MWNLGRCLSSNPFKQLKLNSKKFFTVFNAEKLAFFRIIPTKKAKIVLYLLCSPAGVVKLVDALDSKSSTRESVRVRFPPPALNV